MNRNTTPPQVRNAFCPIGETLPKCLPEAFTRIELLVIAGTISLLFLFVLPVLASKAHSHQATCFNNLRQIGRAYHLWGNDHEDMLPFWLTPAKGGTANPSIPMYTKTWFQFSALSNELSSPHVLVCPSDSKRPASEFSSNSVCGLFSTNFQNLSVSYVLAEAVPPNYHCPLSADSNLRYDSGPINCARFGSLTYVIDTRGPSQMAWISGMHNLKGNLLYLDGGVEQLDSAGLAYGFRASQMETKTIHIITPNTM